MKLDHQPRLDGIRALAVAMVLQQHFTTFMGRFGFGALGVRLFFVLSGYLISRIIFEYAEREIPVRGAAAQFYWRRALRLTPPLYLAIAITATFGLSDMRQDWIWHALYLTNLKVYLDGSFGPATTFWSLAVEEQFYLIWFFVLIATPQRHALKLIVSGIATGVLFKIATLMAGSDWASVLLPGAIDFFCLGALVAYAECFEPGLDAVMRRWFSSPILVTIVFSAIMATLAAPSGVSKSILLGLLEGFLSFCLIVSARNGRQGRYLNLLAHPIARHLGKISYGIYVYHYFVPQFLTHFGLLEIMKQSAGGKPLMFVTEIALTLAVAELSWRLVEIPVSKLRPLVSVKRADHVPGPPKTDVALAEVVHVPVDTFRKD